MKFSIIDSPPTPGRPFEVKAQSTSITIGWSESYCDGGHPIVSFNIQYYQTSGYYYNRNTVRNIDPTRRNYTITGLQSSTYYSVRVRAVSVNSQTSSYSSSISISTLAPGTYISYMADLAIIIWYSHTYIILSLNLQLHQLHVMSL